MQENNQPTQPVTGKNNKNNILVIIGIVIAIVAVILVIVLVVKPNEGGSAGGGEVVNPVEKKIVLTGSNIGDNNVLVKVSNEKVDTYDVDFELVVFDEEKTAVRTFEETVYSVSPNSTTYHIVDTTDVLKDNYTYEIKVKSETKKDSSKIYNDKVTQKSTKTEDAIEVELRNTTKEVIDSVQISIVYLNAKNVVDYTSQFISDFPADSGIIETVYIPTDESGNKIKFDDYKVVITAYNHEK